MNRRKFVLDSAVGALVIGVPGIAIAAKEKFYAGIVRDSNDARIAIIDDDLSTARIASCSLLDKTYIEVHKVDYESCMDRAEIFRALQ